MSVAVTMLERVVEVFTERAYLHKNSNIPQTTVAKREYHRWLPEVVAMREARTTSDRNKGGRPTGSRNRSLPEAMAESTDRLLLQVIRKGTPAFDSYGKPVIDADGKQVYRPATASHIRAAVARLATIKGGKADASSASEDLSKAQEDDFGAMVKRMLEEERQDMAIPELARVRERLNKAKEIAREIESELNSLRAKRQAG